MKISSKQKTEIESVRYFSIKEDFTDSCNPPSRCSYSYDKDGLSPEEAYVKITTLGKKLVTTTDIQELNRLLWGQRWLNWHITTWSIDILNGLIYESELSSHIKKDYSQNVCSYLFKRLHFKEN